MQAFFTTIFFQPLYNLLIFLIGIIPGHQIGLAVILLTLLVKIVLFPFQHQASVTQRKLKAIDPQIKKIKDHPSKEEQAKMMMALYREHGINPLAGFLILLIQLPIIFALYYVFRSGFNFKPELVYSFVSIPTTTNTIFLNLIDITKTSYWLALATGVSQFFQMKLAIPPLPPPDPDKAGSFSDDLARSMQLQTKYLMPVFIIFIATQLPAALAIYWITSSLFAIGHELIVKRMVLAKTNLAS